MPSPTKPEALRPTQTILARSWEGTRVCWGTSCFDLALTSSSQQNSDAFARSLFTAAAALQIRSICLWGSYFENVPNQLGVSFPGSDALSRRVWGAREGACRTEAKWASGQGRLECGDLANPDRNRSSNASSEPL